MKTNRNSRFCYALAALTAGLAAQAAETLIPGGTFDSSLEGWYWEDWSAPGSSISFDSTLNSPRGAAGSGSLRLRANFTDQTVDWQQAIYTKGMNLDASVYKQLTMDVKVDPTSIPRAGGDFGYIQAIVRDGGNWDWRQAGFVTLTGTEWRRIRFNVPAEVADTRALSLQLAQSEMLGPVTVNVDNIAWSDALIISAFDLGDMEGWGANWGTNPILTHNSEDATGQAGSGSLKVDAQYITDAQTWQQMVISKAFPAPVNMSGYTRIELDVKVDPASTIGRDNAFGWFEIKNPNGGANIGGGRTLGASATEWTHLAFDVPPTLATLDGLIIQLGSGSYLGPVAYSVDNITFIPRVGETPPPTLSIEKARTGGMSIIATGTGQYDRHNVRTLTTMVDEMSFIDKTTPMTYSFELLGHPSNPPYAGFQTHVFLVPGAAAAQNDSTPDWNAPTVIFLDLRAAENGAGGTAVFRYKVNVPGGNTGIYAAGLPSLTTTKLLGTWSIRVTDRVNFTITAPGGEVLEVTLPEALAAAFWTDEASGDASLAYYVGVQPNQLANIGQGIVLGSMSVKEGETPIVSSTFETGPLDPAQWTIAGPQNAVQFNTEAGFVVSWTLPDNGFTDWQYASRLTNPDWTPITFSTQPVTVGTKKQLLIPAAEMPSTPTGQFYLRMVKPAAP